MIASLEAARQDDPEIAAINTMIAILSGLDNEARARVVGYVVGRLAIPERNTKQLALAKIETSVPVTDIRTFAKEKNPLTAIDRTAVVAFYLAEVAADSERRRSVGQEEVVRYFKQAGFPLPSSPPMALVHAKNAGFFEVDGPGQYRLNAVGYNLVAHRMPKEGSDRAPLRRARSGVSRAKLKKSAKALPPPK